MDEELIFTAAVEKRTKAERSEYLADACGGNESLRRRIQALLDSHEQTQFLRTSAVEQAAKAYREEATARVTDTSVDLDPERCVDFLAPSDKPGSIGRLGHYEVQEVIGRGGMGIVLRAVDEKLQRVVAIKVMAAELATSATARRRFAREAKAAAAVSHDHIVTVHAVEEADGLPYLVMQYVAGVSLQDRLAQQGPLPLEEILRIGMQAASALVAAHAQGLIHRDIKPANILLEQGIERAKLTDFGLARAVDDASLTHGSVVAGTPQYMAPEQARGEVMDQRADLFSLGSVLYAMCTGRAPFRASGTMAVLKRVCDESPVPIRTANPDIPEWLVAIITKLQAKDPADRYQSAAEVADVLEQCLRHVQQPSTVPLPASAMVSRTASLRGRRRWTAVALGLLGLAGGLVLVEGLGVTQLATMARRILSTDGTLVVETKDPKFAVEIPGLNGQDITGLSPAEYAEVGAFVVIGGSIIPERSFDTLAEAVTNSRNGDRIEIRGNGPFTTKPIIISGHSLRIQAGAGYRPVIIQDKDSPANSQLLTTNANLALEGLEFQRIADGPVGNAVAGPYLVFSVGPSLWITNCRFLTSPNSLYRNDVLGLDADRNVVRNCEFICPSGISLSSHFGESHSFLIENNILIGKITSDWWVRSPPSPSGDHIRLGRNTIIADRSPAIYIGCPDANRPLLESAELGLVKIDAYANLIHSDSIFWLGRHDWQLRTQDEDRALLKKLIAWSDRDNLYSIRKDFAATSDNQQNRHLGIKTTADWSSFWGNLGTKIHEGAVHFQGGNLSSRLFEAPDKLVAADFRLRPDSAGYRAGPDGEDLGADVDLVGPGAAYERWKQTPDYQKWLEETQAIPFKGQLAGRLITRTPIAPPEFRDHFELTGNSTHLGLFKLVIEAEVNFGTRPVSASGTYTFIAANGDVLVARFTGSSALVRPGHVLITENATIDPDSSTGRFSNATGEFVVRRLADAATGVNGVTLGSFDGTISTPNR
ncbi:MAG: serine/threonine-protein kinase [Pirellulales bacterium]